MPRDSGRAERSAEREVPPEERARDICLRLLTGAPKTRHQLETALARRGIDEAVARTVLDRLTDAGLVDDEAYADAWVRSRQAGRGLARRALGAELRARGVEDEVVRDAVGAIDDATEDDAARRLVERRLPSLAGLPVETQMRRLTGLLARKGYSGAVAARTVRAALTAAKEPAPDDAAVAFDAWELALDAHAAEAVARGDS